jgi:hypothetical protein
MDFTDFVVDSLLVLIRKYRHAVCNLLVFTYKIREIR